MLTNEQITNFPVRHLSPSAIRSYLGDRQLFFKRYIRLEFDQKRGPAALEGSCVHAILAEYWKMEMEGKGRDFDWIKSTESNLRSFFSEEYKEWDMIDWGKTGDPEKSKRKVRTAIEFYVADLPDYIPVNVEEAFISDFEDMENNTQPIPVKCIVDLLVGHEKDEKKYGIIDHKVTTMPKEPGQPAPAYEIQACANFFAVRKHFGLNPYSMIFDQIKPTKNRDGGEQRIPYEIIFDAKTLHRFIVLYQRIIAELAGQPLIDENTGTMAFLPNPDAPFNSGEESWLDFCEEVDAGKTWTMKEIREIQDNRYSDEGVTALDL